MNEDIENEADDEVADLLIHDNFEQNDASTRIEQELHAEVGVFDNVELDHVHEANNAESHASTDSDDRINVGNQKNDEQAESMFPDALEMIDTSMPLEQQLQVQSALDSVEVDTSDKATDANSHPSIDSDNRIDAENMVVDESEDFRIHKGFETNDTNAEQTELMVDDDFEMNDASKTIEQDLQLEADLDSVRVYKADNTTGAYSHASTNSDDRIDVDNITYDEGRDLMIHDGFEMNDAFMIIGLELQVDNVTHKQTNAVMEGSSKNIEEQMTIE